MKIIEGFHIGQIKRGRKKGQDSIILGGGL